MLRDVVGQVVASAGLALVRGPVGVGKSFALDAIHEELEADGVKVVRVTATPTIEGSINAFVQAVLAPYGSEYPSTLQGVEAMAARLEGYPFQGYGPKAVLLTDEAQGLKASILEMIRGLWDRGDAARGGNIHAPAFGCVLVGNDQFMSRGGHVRKARFEPLLSRVTHDVRLPRPARDEFEALARAIYPKDDELRLMLAELGERMGNLRAMDVASRQAAFLADQGDVGAGHLRDAIMMMGGR